MQFSVSSSLDRAKDAHLEVIFVYIIFEEQNALA